MANVTITIPDDYFHHAILEARKAETTISALLVARLNLPKVKAPKTVDLEAAAPKGTGYKDQRQTDRDNYWRHRCFQLQGKLNAKPKAEVKVIEKIVEKVVIKKVPGPTKIIHKREGNDRLRALIGRRNLSAKIIRGLRRENRKMREALDRLAKRNDIKLDSRSTVAKNLRKDRGTIILAGLDAGKSVAEIAEEADCSRYNIHYYIRKYRKEKP